MGATTGRRALAVFVVAGLLGACGGSTGGSRAARSAPRTAAKAAGAGSCDDTDTAACLLPWPNDRFTRRDASTATGRRLNLRAAAMPTNAAGVHIDPREWNRNDGFSPASNLITVIPGLDPVASRLPPVTDIGASRAADSPLVLVDLTSGRRVPAWAELDTNDANPATRALIIVPATELLEGHREAVGLRNLKRSDGSRIAPSPGFAKLRSSPTADQRHWLDGLARAGAPTRELTIAWSFTVASAASLSGRLRHMWAETRTGLGDGAPPFHVTSSSDDGAIRIVRGTFEMPRYLTGDGGPGSVLNNDRASDGVPSRNGSMDADFVCTVPKAATAQHPASMLVYGHGLLGSRDEALDIGRVGAAVDVGFCATDWLGMSSADVPTVLSEFKDLSRFRTQPDRMQQGQLAFLLLGRLLHNAKGFTADVAFRSPTGPVIDTSRVAFLGASEGAILGGVASALTTDWNKVVLAVGGLGYNLLLRRSVDFDRFAGVFEANYPSELARVLTLDLIEQLWDRGENAGDAQHLTAKPYKGSSAKTVLLLEAFGDHQVANVGTEKLARTLGVARRSPTLAPGRSTDVAPFWGIPPIPTLPHRGSGLVVWDFGTPAPPVTNTPNRQGEDPHGKLSDVPQALALLMSFLADGTIVDVCHGAPCSTPG